MASASKTPINVFFNEEIKKKYDEVFASRPVIFEKSFDVKEEPHLGFTPEFMLVVAINKWESFIQQKGISIQLTGAESKEKEKMNEPTPKTGTAKTMSAPTPAKAVLEEPMPTNLLMLLPNIARNQEAIFKKVQRMEHKCI
ncbi:hypothetical protein V6N11_033962 [Hibiscus sabdariffa]|uniref:Uncharacterized protein n=1 Tax=Hibiscus sabdariffa TaxID=183260 RepID=A0ABR2S1A4_9ROSI